MCNPPHGQLELFDCSGQHGHMTIAGAYLTSEGVVFGADSTTTVSRGDDTVQLLNHAQKVFEIGSSGRFGICTWGSGRVGETSHRTISARLGDWIKSQSDEVTLEAAAGQLVELAREAASEVEYGLEFGYFLGGRDPDRTPGCLEIKLKSVPEARKSGGEDFLVSTAPLPIGGASFNGAPDYFTRIFHGFASGFPSALSKALVEEIGGDDASKEKTRKQFGTAFSKVRPQFCSKGYDDLPLREAIDFICTYLSVTIKAFKFRSGPPICGGPLEIGFVSTDREFRWIRHKDFGSAIAEQLGI
jgi:hypothetical protein